MMRIQEDIVLCKIYRKATSLKVLEERAAMEEKSRTTHPTPPSPPSQGNFSSTNPQESFVALTVPLEEDIVFKTEEEQEHESKVSLPSLIGFGSMKDNLTELEVPKFNMEFMTVDHPLWSQLRSPWLDNWSTYANALNF
ncbi:hypothetical protein TEA_017429 [Camellia sinensis var. sinensis]|uniref:NAC domain-containing protein n=1 Tax=Camellia sinensis var. sinensis TaxID=542762 RepID=A0A4S4E9B7_CAMSN|nr:hypothetical protein TEA_017429 [Camellia sinensis var. sinensis]